MWYVYIVRCVDDTLYTGIAKDVPQRLAQHNAVKHGARYTKSRQPVELVYQRRVKNRVYALREEYRIKQLPRAAKLGLIASTT